MSRAAEALILTWVMIGLILAGGAGFYLRRMSVSKSASQTLFDTQGGQRQVQQQTNQPSLPSGIRQECPILPQGGQNQQSGTGQPLPKTQP